MYDRELDEPDRCQGLATLATDTVLLVVSAARFLRLSTSSLTASDIDLYDTVSRLSYREVTAEKEEGSDEVKAATSMSSTDIFPSLHILRRRVPSLEMLRRWSMMSSSSVTWRPINDRRRWYRVPADV